MAPHAFSPEYDTDPRCALPGCDAWEDVPVHDLTAAVPYVPYDRVTWWTPAQLVTLPPGATTRAPTS